MKPLFAKKELLLLALLLAAAALWLLLASAGAGKTAVVSYAGRELMRIDLAADGVYTVQGDLPATLEVSGGRIRFVGSVCPDRICEAFGWIGTEGESAICMPARLAVQIVGV